MSINLEKKEEENPTLADISTTPDDSTQDNDRHINSSDNDSRATLDDNPEISPINPGISSNNPIQQPVKKKNKFLSIINVCLFIILSILLIVYFNLSLTKRITSDNGLSLLLSYTDYSSLDVSSINNGKQITLDQYIANLISDTGCTLFDKTTVKNTLKDYNFRNIAKDKIILFRDYVFEGKEFTIKASDLAEELIKIDAIDKATSELRKRFAIESVSDLIYNLNIGNIGSEYFSPELVASVSTFRSGYNTVFWSIIILVIIIILINLIMKKVSLGWPIAFTIASVFLFIEVLIIKPIISGISSIANIPKDLVNVITGYLGDIIINQAVFVLLFAVLFWILCPVINLISSYLFKKNN